MIFSNLFYAWIESPILANRLDPAMNLLLHLRVLSNGLGMPLVEVVVSFRRACLADPVAEKELQ